MSILTSLSYIVMLTEAVLLIKMDRFSKLTEIVPLYITTAHDVSKAIAKTLGFSVWSTEQGPRW